MTKDGEFQVQGRVGGEEYGMKAVGGMVEFGGELGAGINSPYNDLLEKWSHCEDGPRYIISLAEEQHGEMIVFADILAKLGDPTRADVGYGLTGNIRNVAVLWLDIPNKTGTYLQFAVAQFGTHKIVVVGDGYKEAMKRVQEVRDLFPNVNLPVLEETPTADIAFWNTTPTGTQHRTRRLGVPKWKDVGVNYGQRTKAALEQFIKTPRDTGIVLFHGEPGTGKTSAIRCLAWELREHCKFDYIIDPEAFFSSPGYMLDVLVGNDEPSGNGNEEYPWRILLLEDTGELLTSDAKERVGQGLSRLLNISDGLIGQGLKITLLITTNEPLGKMHPAVTRAGRCGARIEFSKLSRVESSAWAKAHDLTPGDVTEENNTLAQLYEILKPRVIADMQKQGMGFHQGFSNIPVTQPVPVAIEEM